MKTGRIEFNVALVENNSHLVKEKAVMRQLFLVAHVNAITRHVSMQRSNTSRAFH